LVIPPLPVVASEDGTAQRQADPHASNTTDDDGLVPLEYGVSDGSRDGTVPVSFPSAWDEVI
jgi:hypothetical protein